MAETLDADLIAVTQKLLDAIAAGEWQTYTSLCDSTLSCFEPEAGRNLVQGLDFHRYYFELETPASPKQNTISSPHVRRLGDDSAVVSYTRLVQCLDADGSPTTVMSAETRVWQRRDGQWQNVHFHRS